MTSYERLLEVSSRHHHINFFPQLENQLSVPHQLYQHQHIGVLHASTEDVPASMSGVLWLMTAALRTSLEKAGGLLH